MNIFNRIMPWFIPTKSDQSKWYTEELLGIPNEQKNLLREFSELSERYNQELGDFESQLARTDMYDRYINIRSMAQQVNFLWNRIEYKQKREDELKKFLSELN